MNFFGEIFWNSEKCIFMSFELKINIFIFKKIRKLKNIAKWNHEDSLLWS